MLKTLVLQKNIHLLKLQFPNTIQLKVKTKQIKAHLWFLGPFREFLFCCLHCKVYLFWVCDVCRKNKLDPFRPSDMLSSTYDWSPVLLFNSHWSGVFRLPVIGCALAMSHHFLPVIGCVLAMSHPSHPGKQACVIRLTPLSSPRLAGLCYPSHSSFFSQASRPVLSFSLLLLLPR